MGVPTAPRIVKALGVPSTESFGLVRGQTLLAASGIPSATALGDPLIDRTQRLLPPAIETAEAFGGHAWGARFTAPAIPSEEAFGRVARMEYLSPLAIVTGFAAGAQSIARAFRAIGIASLEALGLLRLIGVTPDTSHLVIVFNDRDRTLTVTMLLGSADRELKAAPLEERTLTVTIVEP